MRSLRRNTTGRRVRVFSPAWRATPRSRAPKSPQGGARDRAGRPSAQGGAVGRPREREARGGGASHHPGHPSFLVTFCSRQNCLGQARQIRRDRIWTGEACPKGEDHGWSESKSHLPWVNHPQVHAAVGRSTSEFQNSKEVMVFTHGPFVIWRSQGDYSPHPCGSPFGPPPLSRRRSARAPGARRSNPSGSHPLGKSNIQKQRGP